jgi:UDP-N-acetylmuramate--alanine ligase
MHIYFSGIGGTGIGPLALIAKQAGHSVSGSDKQDSGYIAYLKKYGITDIHIGQNASDLEQAHQKNPIDWFVYSSAVEKENAKHPELEFVKQQDIKHTKRDALINFILKEKNLDMIAVAGTHGKTTTTAMLIWLFKQLDIPISYSVGAKMSFGDMGVFEQDSKYFVYEADEYDRNFLAFEPHTSLITGVTWDHHEVFPTREDYQEAFKEFIKQSDQTVLWSEDANYLGLSEQDNLTILQSSNPDIEDIELAGQYNRLDAWLAMQTVHKITKEPMGKLQKIIEKFPGIQRRMEEIALGLYSDYAHTVEKIRGAMSVALEMAEKDNKQLVIIYEPLHNRRQHYIKQDYKDCFDGASTLYWVPSYLAREDPTQSVITPAEMITYLDNSQIAQPMELDEKLKDAIQNHLQNGDMVVAMSGGGGNSLDEWLRKEFNA